MFKISENRLGTGHHGASFGNVIQTLEGGEYDLLRVPSFFF